MSGYPLHEVEGYIDEAMHLLPDGMDSEKARVMLRAIALQESRMKHRWQVVDGGGKGPAIGLWQFERNGGVRGVLEHRASKNIAHSICLSRSVVPEPKPVWLALETDDVLAACFARLLLWTDPSPLPPIGDEQAAWNTYIKNWRPGRPHRHTWDEFYALSVEFCR